ncbi:MAG TPA: hypothetical protein DCY13_14435 [Verrucomicrobiales bacterium]|nr:hypothetical protein [Verrucomicrobiales bacterium]
MEAAHLREEVERLRADLSRSKQAATGVTKKMALPTGPSAVSQPSVADEPKKEQVIAEPLPAVREGEIVDVTDILKHYQRNAAEAIGRYESQTIRLQGVIAGFEKPAFRRDYEIVFRSADGQLVCRVQPPPSYAAVFTTQSGSTLSARNERGGQWDLMKIGDVVTIEGRGAGLRDGSIQFTRCQVLSVR